MRAGPPPRFARSPHLVALIAEVERLVSLVGRADPDARGRLRAETAREVLEATLRLDGADPARLPDPDAALRTVAAHEPRVPPRDPARAGTWLDALRVFHAPTDDQVRALEVLGVGAADESDDLVPGLATEPVEALAELHRRLTRGLLDEELAGSPRRSEQAVHDGSTGRILYFPAEPDLVTRELGLLAAWVASTGSREHGVVASGVLHHELLRIHPFEAANGRLARSAARLALRARGLDPDHLAAPEPALARDPLGYYQEVASSLRRRDLTIWLERWAEAVVEGLRDAARGLGLLEPSVDQAHLDFVAEQPEFTVADFRARAGVGPAAARDGLAALLDAGVVRWVPGSRGLRFTSSAVGQPAGGAPGHPPT